MAGSPLKRQRKSGMSLDDIHEILSWRPISELGQFRLSVKMQVMRIVFAMGTKALLDVRLGREAARERNRDAVLNELARRLDGAGKAKGVVAG
jgi:DNA-binding transcriptional MerR regulator